MEAATAQLDVMWTGAPILRCPWVSTTLSYMKTATVTIRLDAKLQRELSRLSRQLGRSRSELVRDALRRQLALVQFEQARRNLLPLAEAQGFLTDEDVFADVS
jgi:predicted transcriptional regulator